MSLDCWSECWTTMCNGAKPTAEFGHFDCSESYEMDMMHVFALDNGQYATVHESGCSCYESSQAEIELFPRANDAIDKYFEYRKAQGGAFNNLELLEYKVWEKEQNESLSKNNNP